MPGAWDLIMKQLLDQNTQQFVSWLLNGGQLVEALSIELKRRDIYADALYKVDMHGQSMLLHIEFQSRSHKHMAERLLEYSVQASRTYDFLPVRSVVIYLTRDTQISESPYIQRTPDGFQILRFQYGSIKLWEIPARTILDTGFVGLLPLLPLCKDGQSMEIVDEIIERIGTGSDQKEMLALTYSLAGLAFKDPADLEALKRRFAMLDEIMQTSSTYQDIQQKGVEKGREEERAANRQQWLASQRDLVLGAVKTRFPALFPLALEKIPRVQDPQALQQVIAYLLTNQNLPETEVEGLLERLA